MFIIVANKLREGGEEHCFASLHARVSGERWPAK